MTLETALRSVLAPGHVQSLEPGCWNVDIRTWGVSRRIRINNLHQLHSFNELLNLSLKQCFANKYTGPWCTPSPTPTFHPSQKSACKPFKFWKLVQFQHSARGGGGPKVSAHDSWSDDGSSDVHCWTGPTQPLTHMRLMRTKYRQSMNLGPLCPYTHRNWYDILLEASYCKYSTIFFNLDKAWRTHPPSLPHMSAIAGAYPLSPNDEEQGFIYIWWWKALCSSGESRPSLCNCHVWRSHILQP